MKKNIVVYFLILILLPLFLPKSVHAEEKKMRALSQTEREDLLGRLKSIQTKIKTFEANFVEERKIQSLPSSLIYKGTLYYERNNLFFMKYSHPVEYVFRMKGTEVLIYVIGSATADIVDISNNEMMTGHTDIFSWDPGNFKGHIYEDADGFWLKERAQKPGGPKLNILLDSKTLLVKHFTIISQNGDMTTIAFSEKKINKTLPSEIRNFTLPKGTKRNRLSPP